MTQTGQVSDSVVLMTALPKTVIPLGALQAFDVFDLAGGSANEKLARVRKACDVDEAELSVQWLDVYPRAQRLMKHDAESGNKNKDAWRLALQRLSLARGGHPTAALRSALGQYLVFGASSSGVEQDFSKLHLGLGYVRDSALPSTEEFAAKAIWMRGIRRTKFG